MMKPAERRTTLKENKKNYEKEILLTKHCHVLLQNLPESEIPSLGDNVPKTGGQRKAEKELEHHWSSTSKADRGRDSATLKEKKKYFEKEILITKHCHVYLERFPESELPTVGNKVTKTGGGSKEEELLPSTSKGFRGWVNTPSTQTASKIEALTKQRKAADSKVQISRKTRKYTQDNKDGIQIPKPYHSKYKQKLDNDSTVELSQQKDKVPGRDDRSNSLQKVCGERSILMSFPRTETKSLTYKDDESSKLCIRLGHNFFVKLFKKYLYALKGNERSHILYELMQRNLEQELTSNENRELIVNEGLVEWIVENSRNGEKVKVEEHWEIIKIAAEHAERELIRETQTSESKNRMPKKRTAQVDENFLFNQRKVPKLFISTLVEDEVDDGNPVTENASPSVKEISDGSEHLEISSEENGKHFTNTLNLLVDEEPKSDKTETFVENLKKYDKTRRPSIEYDIGSENSTEQLESACESEKVSDTFSPTDVEPFDERSMEDSDKVQEITFDEQSENKLKTLLTSDTEEEINANAENFVSNDKSDDILYTENNMPATGNEISTSEFEETVGAKSSRIAGERKTIEILLAECMELVANQDVIPLRAPSEMYVRKIKTSYDAATSDAEGKDSSYTKTTTSDRNCLPVSTDGVEQVNNTPENASSVAEAQTCYEDQTHLSSDVGSVSDSSEQSEDSLTAEVPAHAEEPWADIFSYDEVETSEFLNDLPMIIYWDPEILQSNDSRSPDLTSVSLNDTEGEKSDSSSSTASTPDETSCDKIEIEDCDEKRILRSDDLSYLNKLVKSQKFGNGYLSEYNAFCQNKDEEGKKKRLMKTKIKKTK